jgi:hypothetical protein
MCHNGIVYAREVDGKTLTLGVSGMLWNSSLVMYDKETGTLWSHILGEAKQGRLKGKQLRQLPSVMTDWQSWRTQYSDSTVAALSRTSDHYTREFYDSPRGFVLGIADDDKAKAWGFDLLKESPAINDEFRGKPVLVAFDRASMTPRLYERTLLSRVLTFRLENGKLTDAATGSTWEPVTGRAISGPLADQFLKPLTAIVSYRHVWLKFHPDSAISHAPLPPEPLESN